MKTIVFLFFLLVFSSSAAQQKLPVIQSGQVKISMRENGKLFDNYWRITPEAKPDVYTTQISGKANTVSFVTDIDSITYTVKPGETYDFIILLNGKDSAYTQIKGQRFTEPALFNAAYIKANTGKTFTEIPEVYELVNVVLSITPAAKADKDIVQQTGYYKEVQEYFTPFSKDSLVKQISDQLDRGWYAQLKMDAYAFRFDTKGKIVKSDVYDRVSWGNENTLSPFIKGLQAFADKSKFRKFYAAHQSLYKEQIRQYQDSINIPAMIAWLRTHFPSTDYQSFRVIWSPLVGGNQSANWFENNGFKEAQQHVNYPYPEWYTGEGAPAVVLLKRGNIIFTELNHAFINPEGEKKQYNAGVLKAFGNLDEWASAKAKADYANAYLIFNEYMNWALVSLYYVDKAPPAELNRMISDIEAFMKRRGFLRFSEFNPWLVQLYQNRKKGETVAGLYPQIVQWFVDHS